MQKSLFRTFLIGWVVLLVPAYGLVERRVERRFAAGSAPILKVDSFYGLVNVREIPGSTEIAVVVVQTADVAGEAEMDRRLEALDLQVGQSADGEVRVSAQFRNSLAWSWKNFPTVTLVYEIQVPVKCNLEIVGGEGAIRTGALQGRVVLKSESGTIFTGEVDGALEARSRTGAVAITACTGPLEVSTDTGNITVGRAGGPARLASRGGYIELQRASGEVAVRGNGSDVEVGFVSPILHPADIVTSGGSVSLVIENSVACTLDLRASLFGSVKCRGPLPLAVSAGGEGRSVLRGTVNGGGARIQARAGGGNVLLRSVDPVPGYADSRAAKADARPGGGA